MVPQVPTPNGLKVTLALEGEQTSRACAPRAVHQTRHEPVPSHTAYQIVSGSLTQAHRSRSPHTIHAPTVRNAELKAAGVPVKWTEHKLNFGANEQKEPWFLAINPNGTLRLTM